MGSNQYTYTINYNGGNPEFASTPTDPPDLKEGDWVVVQLGSDFPSGSSIDTLSFYHDSGKSDLACQWNRGGSDNCASIYTITETSTTEVQIEDAENPNTDDPYWFTVGGSPNGWSVDPELINEPTGG